MPGFIRNIPPFVYAVIVLAIIFFVYQMIGGTFAVLVEGTNADFDVGGMNVGLMRLILSFSQFMLMLAPTVFFARLQTPDLKSTFRLNMPVPLIFILAIVGMILLQPLLQGYMYFQDLLLDNLPFMQDSVRKLRELFDMFETATVKVVRAYSLPEFLVVVFVIGITPAICEEMLFRGFVLSNFRKTMKPLAAVLLSGFMFAFYHFQPFNIIPLFLLGFYLGFVVYCTNSIYTGMVCHFLNNFLSAYLLFIYGKEEFDTPHLSASEKADYALMTAVSLILFILVLYWIYKLYSKKQKLNSPLLKGD